MSQSMGFEFPLAGEHADIIDTVTAALKDEGFGVLTRIDVDKAFKEKIGADFRPYTILGACNPTLAHTALSSRPDLGLMLPCNVTVEQQAPGQCFVRIVDPKMMMGMGDLASDPTITEVAGDAYTRLKRVADTLSQSAQTTDAASAA